MKPYFYYLVVSLCALMGPISVRSYLITVSNSIHQWVGKLTPAELASGEDLMSGDLCEKRHLALTLASGQGVWFTENVMNPYKLGFKLRKYNVDGNLVVGILVNNEPPVIISTASHVYAQRNTS